MPRPPTLSRVAPALALAAFCAAATPAGAAGVRGEVLDATCYGPCVVDGEPPPPYGGDDAKVTVRRAGKDHERVASEFAEEGRFRFRLKPGDYVVKVRVKSPPPNSWSRDRERIEVEKGESERVTLTVANAAVL